MSNGRPEPDYRALAVENARLRDMVIELTAALKECHDIMRKINQIGGDLIADCRAKGLIP